MGAVGMGPLGTEGALGLAKSQGTAMHQALLLLGKVNSPKTELLFSVA